MTERTMLVAIGKINTKFPRSITMSPGSLKRFIFGTNKKRRPTTTKTSPRTMKNLAKVLMACRHNGHQEIRTS
jgi:hypothetical protein